jgi:hypothetical protein
MRIFAQAYQWQSYCKKLSNQKKNSSFFHRKQKKSNFYQFPRKIGDSCQGTGTWHLTLALGCCCQVPVPWQGVPWQGKRKKLHLVVKLLK